MTTNVQERTKKMKLITLLIGATLVLFVSLPTVLSLGVAPSSYSVDYEEGKSYDLALRILNNEQKDYIFRISAIGDLAPYVRFDQEGLIEVRASESEKSIYYTITPPTNLPEGPQTLDILLEEIVDTTKVTSGAQINTNFNLKQKVNLRVPYTGAFISGELFAVGDQIPIEFVAHLVNRGIEGAVVTGTLSIRSPTNAVLYTQPLQQELLPALTDKKLKTTLNQRLLSGSYLAEFTAAYDGKQIVLQRPFSIGDFTVDTLSLNVDRYLYGEIAKLQLVVQSNWNRPIQALYAEIELINTLGQTVASFQSPTISMQPSTPSTLDVFIDTQNVPIGEYTVLVRYYHDGAVTEETFGATFGVDDLIISGTTSPTGLVTGEDDGDNTLIGLIVILILVVVALNVVLVVYLVKKKK